MVRLITKCTALAVLVAIVAALSIILSLTHEAFDPFRWELVTFWVSFLVGTTGAGVYLLLLLMTEKNLAVLKNRHIQNLSIMTFFYLLSGGFVAAVTQVSAGFLTSSNVHGVFLVGFGWQGAMTGVAGTSARVELSEEVSDKTIDATRAEEKGRAIKERLEREIEELREKLRVKAQGVSG